MYYYFKKESINYFYDIDDLIYINTKNSNIGNKDINLDSFYKILSNATKVICSNIYIKEKLVTKHIDYWDSGRNFYSHLPVIGAIFRRIHK